MKVILQAVMYWNNIIKNVFNKELVSFFIVAIEAKQGGYKSVKSKKHEAVIGVNRFESTYPKLLVPVFNNTLKTR